MVCLNIYLFNRQGLCVFYHDWHRTQSAAQGVGSTESDQKQMFGFLWTMSNFCVAIDPKDVNKQQLGAPRRLGQGCRFHSCTTNNYKLHFLEVPTGFKLVLNTSRDAGDLRDTLSALYDELLVDRLVKNPNYTPGTPLAHPEDFAQSVTVWLKHRGIL